MRCLRNSADLSSELEGLDFGCRAQANALIDSGFRVRNGIRRRFSSGKRMRVPKGSSWRDKAYLAREGTLPVKRRARTRLRYLLIFSFSTRDPPPSFRRRKVLTAARIPFLGYLTDGMEVRFSALAPKFCSRTLLLMWLVNPVFPLRCNWHWPSF